MTSASTRFGAGALALLLLAAGCSRSDSDGGSSRKDDRPTSTVAADVAPAKAFELDAPVKVVALISDPENSSDGNAIPDFNDGARMAIDEINAAGGLGGHDVELVTIDTPPVGDEVVNAFNLAVAEKPTAIVGPVSSTATLAIADRAEQEEIPLIHNSTDPALATDGEAGNPWVFASRPRNDEAATAAATFLTEELGAKEVGLLSVNASFGQQGIAAAKQVLGAKAGAARSFEYNATNLTEPIQAMDGSDAVLDWGTPNTLAASVVAAAQQGLDVPHMGPGSIGFSSFKSGVGDDAVLKNVYGTVDCIPTDDDRGYVGEWADRFETKFGYAPSYSSAELYDSVYLLRKVIESAESADPKDIKDGLAHVESDEGICAVRYRNVDGFLIQESTVGRYEDGEFVAVKRYEG